MAPPFQRFWDLWGRSGRKAKPIIAAEVGRQAVETQGLLAKTAAAGRRLVEDCSPFTRPFDAPGAGGADQAYRGGAQYRLGRVDKAQPPRGKGARSLSAG